jgi:hypothetical protein
MTAPREFIQLDADLVPRLERLIENLIDLCDQLSGDADIEDDAPAEDHELDDDGDDEGDTWLPAHLPGGSSRTLKSRRIF